MKIGATSQKELEDILNVTVFAVFIKKLQYIVSRKPRYENMLNNQMPFIRLKLLHLLLLANPTSPKLSGVVR
jgi:hypothetical protein